MIKTLNTFSLFALAGLSPMATLHAINSEITNVTIDSPVAGGIVGGYNSEWRGNVTETIVNLQPYAASTAEFEHKYSEIRFNTRSHYLCDQFDYDHRENKTVKLNVADIFKKDHLKYNPHYIDNSGGGADSELHNIYNHWDKAKTAETNTFLWSKMGNDFNEAYGIAYFETAYDTVTMNLRIAIGTIFGVTFDWRAFSPIHSEVYASIKDLDIIAND
jgi:hypothetical protein